MAPCGLGRAALEAEVADAVVVDQRVAEALGQKVAAHEVDGQEAGVAEADHVAGVEVDAFRPRLADVLLGCLGVTFGGEPQGALSITVDQVAEQGIAGVGTLLNDVIRCEVADLIGDLDVEVVERDRKACNALRCPDEAGGEGVGSLGNQVFVAAPEGVVLVGGVREDVAVLPREHAGPRALLFGSCGVVTRTDVRGTAETERRRREQLEDVRRADRTVVAPTDSPGVVERPAELPLVGVEGA